MARYLFSLLAALALLVGAPQILEFDLIAAVQAGDGIPAVDRNGRPMRVQRMTGKRITFASTYANFDFEFESDYVQFCVQPGSRTVFMRFGTAVTGGLIEGMEQYTANTVTNSRVFQTGGRQAGEAYGGIAGRAFAVTVSPDTNTAGEIISGLNTQILCQSHPWASRGLVFNVDTAGTATLDVNAFSSR